MGLDMWLYKRNEGTTADNNLDTQIGYWRKFNALHSYILDITDSDMDSNCESIDLDRYVVVQILDTLKRVKHILELPDGFSDEHIDEVRSLLPPQEGFFWGSQDIDEDYLANINHSIEIFKQAEDLLKQGEEIYYYCWW